MNLPATSYWIGETVSKQNVDSMHSASCWLSDCVDSRKSCVVWGVRLTTWFSSSSRLTSPSAHCSVVLMSLKPTVSWLSRVLMLLDKRSSTSAAV